MCNCVVSLDYQIVGALTPMCFARVCGKHGYGEQEGDGLYVGKWHGMIFLGGAGVGGMPTF